MWWNPEELELTNSSCPPPWCTFRGRQGPFGTEASDTRSPSNINIDETIIHIPNSARVDLSTSTTYTETKYPDLWNADKKENRDINGDGTPDNVGDGIVWALPACPPEGTAGTGDLCISFSAALLNSVDWLPINDAEGKGGIVYHLDHIHQTDIDKQDPRYTLAYDVPEDGDATPYVPHWDSSDARVAKMPVEPGEYERPMLFFTSRGTYELQVHITGEPNQDIDDPIAKELSVNDDVREYIFHVGAEADLGVEVTAVPDGNGDDNGDGNLDPGEDVTITVTASNAGPETAPETKVNVSLPPEFIISEVAGELPSATKGTYADGVWTIGSMCNPAEPAEPNANPPKPVCPQEATLTITASVAAGTHGETLTANAAISATETVEITETVDGVDTVVEYHVPVADPTPGNDTAAGSTTVASMANVAPMFQITRSVPENSAAGTNVGDTIAVKEPNTGDTLTFGLTGTGSGHFTATSVAGGAQIAVATRAHLNYEHRPSYDLVLTVSDSKDASGNADSAIDHSIALNISVEDVVDETVSATVAATRQSGQVTWTFTVTNPPADATNVVYRLDLRNTETETLGGAGIERRDSLAESETIIDRYPYASGTYRVEGAVQYDQGGSTHYLHADISGNQTITIP